MQFDIAYAEADVAARVVRVLVHKVCHQQRLWIDEVTVPRQLAVPEPVALARESEFALAMRLRMFQQPVGQPAPFKGAYRPLLDEAARGRCSMNSLLAASSISLAVSVVTARRW
ncbi:hypothetical protein QFZ67_000549 [Streptomyces sp. V1I1]|nr:hypothetical protein [Streptomyces sp. V1I1]